MTYEHDDPFVLSSGSTDFGNVTFVVPGIHPYFYIGSNVLNHTEEYTVAAGVHTILSHTHTHTVASRAC